MTSYDLPLQLVRIEFENIDDAAADKKQYVENYLKDYEGKCHNGALITKIIDVPYISSIYIHPFMLEVVGYVSAGFRCSGIRYERGDVITKCQITCRKENGHVICCQNEHADIFMKSSQQTERAMALKDKSFLPVIVIDTQYPAGRPRLTASALPLDITSEFYQNTGVSAKLTGIKAIPKEDVAKFIKTIVDLQTAKGAHGFFMKLLTPPTGPSPIGSISFLKYLTENTAEGHDTVSIVDSKDCNFWTDEVVITDASPPLERPAVEFFNFVVRRTVMRLTMLRGFERDYPNPREDDIIWKLVKGAGTA
jgi:hypothetical protein